jgi:hypothetical protein
MAAMVNYGMTVEDVGACVRLIDVMTRNLPALGIERSHFDAVHIDEKAEVVRVRIGDRSAERTTSGRRRYTLLLSGIPDSAIADLERLAGTKLKELNEKAPAAETISINELLESVLLIREPRPAAANGLMLALLGTDPDRVDLARWHGELSRLGCRGCRIGCVATEGADLRVLYLIEIARPPPNFVPPADWETRRVLVFSRLRPDVSSPFYIEWGYAHPVRDLARLYQIRDERLVLMAADALERRRGQAVQSQTRVTLKLRSSDWRTIFELPDQGAYTIELATELELRNLEAGPQATDVSVAVDVRSRPLIGGSLTEVEHKIAWHQQAIEQLHRTRQHGEMERQEPVYLVRVFEQYPDEAPADGLRPLPAGFIRFLDRPYTELAGFQYAFFQDPFRPGIWLHAVLDERPGSYERIAADMANDAYVCPQRWWDLGVRLFVRACDTLHPYIEDEALLLRLRDELWRRDDLDHEHPILIRRHPEGTGAAQAICLSRLSRLLAPEVFRLLSTRFDVRVPEFHLGTQNDMLEAQSASVRLLDELAARLETGAEAAIAERVSLIETEWKKADERMVETEKRLAGHLASVAVINELLDRHGASWTEFVKNVLDADRSLSLRKVEAVGRYEPAHELHADAIQLFERGLVDVNARLERDKKEIAARRSLLDEHGGRLATLEQELPAAVATLDDFARGLGARIDDFSARQRRSLDEERGKVDALGQKLEELQRAMQATDEERARADEDQARAESLQAAHKRAIEELDRLKEQYDRTDAAFAAEKAELMPPLDDGFLEWLEEELHGRVEGRSGPAPRLLAWLRKVNRRRRR